MSNTRTEYRVEYRRKFSDTFEWQPRTETHTTLREALNELAGMSECRGCYDFRIVKRTVTEWEEVE